MSEETEVSETTDLVRYEPVNALVQASDPVEFVEKSRQIATALVDVVNDRKLFTVISGRKHPRVEAWTFLGSMMGAFGQAVFAVEEWTRPVMGHGDTFRVSPHGMDVVGWEARVEARTADGSVVGAAEAMCLRAEKTWRGRDDFALRSMAQTRATSKALRQPLGFLMQLAGYEPSPAEELGADAPVVEKPTEEEFALFIDTIGTAETVDPDLWSQANVLKNASIRWSSQFASYQDLPREAVKTITEATEKWLDEHEDADEPVGPPVDVLKGIDE